VNKKRYKLPKKKNKNKLLQMPRKLSDIEDITLRPITMYDVLKHKRMCDASKKDLGKFLGFAEEIGEWEMKHHLKWIASHVKLKGYYQAFGAFYEDHMLGVITFSPAKDFLGIQICYYTSSLYSSRGICTLLTDLMVSRAFFMENFRYVELHIDIENIGSQRVAEKNKFEVVADYECSKSGRLGSGKMQVWVKINPKYSAELSLEDFRNNDDSYLAPAYQSLDSAFNALKELQNLASIVQSLKPLEASLNSPYRSSERTFTKG
jgi:RimJ/RimL family protein N-acetyltransferase